MEKQKGIVYAVIAIEALAILILGALLLQSGGSIVGISADKAGKLAVDFINTNYGEGATPASFVSAKANNGVYAVVINYNGTEYTSYVTKDGKLFFTDGLSIEPAKPVNTETKEFTKTDKPVVDLFVMSFCPYGNVAETAIAPVIGLLGDKIETNLRYIFYGNYGDPAQSSQYCYDTDRLYCSMHGIQELNQDIREVCVAKYAPDKLWSFIEQINADTKSSDVDSKWEAIAVKAGVSVSKIKDCYKNEATTIMAAEKALTEKSYPVQDPSQNEGEAESKILGSPTFVINGMIYNGARTSEDIKKAVCSAFKTAPAECAETLNSTSTAADGSC